MTKKIAFLVLLFVGVAFTAQAQQKIKGVVTDSDGQPLPGVTVVTEDKKGVAETDFDGNYAITAAEGTKLTFSYMGMETKTVTVGGDDTINVSLEESSDVLDEVVVTALGISRDRKKLGYAVQSVKAEKLNLSGTVDINNAMAGKVAGVQFLGGSSADLESAPNIRIRGVNNLTGSGRPLYVVDGTPILNPEDVNMDDVAEMSVLKGASASILYGSRAADGVILIKTKSAKAGETTVTFTNNTTISKLPRWYDTRFQNEYGGGYRQVQRNGDEFASFKYDSSYGPEYKKFDGDPIVNYGADESWGPRFEGQMVRHWDSWYEGPEFGKFRAWEASPTPVSSFFDIGINNRVAVGVTKGTETLKTRFSFTNVRVKGVLPKSSSQKNFLALKTSLQASKSLEIEASVNYTRTNILGDLANKGYGNPSSGMFDQWYQRQIDLNRLKKYKQINRDGSTVYRTWNIRSPKDLRGLYWDSPYRDINESKRATDRHSLVGFVSLTWKILDNLRLKGVSRRTYRTVDLKDQRGATRRNRFISQYVTSEAQAKEDNHEVLLSYNGKLLKNLLSLDVIAGGNIRKGRVVNDQINSNGGLVVKEFWNPSASKDNVGFRSTIVEREVRSVYGTVNLGIAEMLFAEASFRTDYSSTLPKDNNSFSYPGIAGSFIFTELLKKLKLNTPILSFLKVRGSWAQVGADTQPYSLQPTYALSSNKYGSSLRQFTPASKPNEKLKAELQGSSEIGLDVKLFNNRIGFDAAYYKNVNTNQILSVPTPASTGYSSVRINAGQVTTTGWEIALNLQPLRTKSWTWDIDFNIAEAITKIDELYPEKNITRYSLGYWAWAQEGKRWGVFRGDVPKMHNGKPLLNTGGKYVKENDEKKRIVEDKYVTPDYTGGIVSTLSYKLPNDGGSLNLNVAMDYQIGGSILDVNARYANHSGLGIKTVGINDRGGRYRDPLLDKNGNTPKNSSGDPLHYINAEDAGPNTGGMRVEGYTAAEPHKPVAYYLHPKRYFHYSNVYRPYHTLYDATYLKLRELLLSYTLPKKWVEKSGIKNASIGLVLRNVLLYADPAISIDPSQSAASYTSWISYGQLPSANTLGLNLSMTF